jgi:hypothetical protein
MLTGELLGIRRGGQSEFVEPVQHHVDPGARQFFVLSDEIHPTFADLLDQAVLEKLLSGFDGHGGFPDPNKVPRLRHRGPCRVSQNTRLCEIDSPSS